MSEKDSESFSTERENAARTREFALADFKPDSISSSETPEKTGRAENDLQAILARTQSAPPAAPDKIEDPIFKLLAEPTLAAPQRSDRARLQMQSPTRLHFYWSLKTNPFETLRRIFGGAANEYTLVVKLSNAANAPEEIYPVEAEGSWWFDVDADSSYQAEIGFYSANRPFVRLMSSNHVQTPRRNPSTRAATESDWTVSANDFAEVLDASGFAQDAFEVALAGDDFARSETATKAAFAQMFGETDNDFVADNSSEMRFALLAIAAGYAPDDLRGQISHSLFVRLQKNAADLNAERARAVLQSNFGAFEIDETIETEALLAPTVFGASLINFPRQSKRRLSPKFAPLSSFNFAANR